MASVSRGTAPLRFHNISTSPDLFLHWSRPSPRRNIQSRGTPRILAVKIASDGSDGKIGSDQVLNGHDLLRKPILSVPDDQRKDDQKSGHPFLDWEDQILSETVPLVGLVRMILHSGRYKSGDRLSPEHEEIIAERLLPYHPKYEEKIGYGIDHIEVGYHPDFESSRCLFVVQKDGELVDFSYWKCVKGLIKKKYPLQADSFILRHFRRHWRRE